MATSSLEPFAKQGEAKKPPTAAELIAWEHVDDDPSSVVGASAEFIKNASRMDTLATLKGMDMLRDMQDEAKEWAFAGCSSDDEPQQKKADDAQVRTSEFPGSLGLVTMAPRPHCHQCFFLSL